ncbi:MAG: CDP-alcohol phosphatidyltransferase family protein [Nitrososphaerota archaeon]|nr:CDP-alcohol phosphatidyltransferase family protein [Nitrososphaerota archaeon]
MLTRLRQRVAPAVERVASACGRVMPSPNAWTALGLLLALAAAYSYRAGLAPQAGALVLASGFTDLVDGAVARKLGKATPRGGFLDSNLDRVGESAVYLGLMTGPWGLQTVAAVAMAASLLVSYSRSRAEAAGLKAEGVGYGERAERLAVLALSSLAGYVYYGVVVVAVLAAVTFAQRLYVYGSKL